MAKILIAEDDNFLADAYKVKFIKMGYEVRMATDGEEVIYSLMGNFIPDIIILDLMMPKKDGLSVLQELKANKAWKDIPVLIASNLGQKEDIDKGMALGAVDFIIKSDASLEDIKNKVNKYIKNDKGSL